MDFLVVDDDPAFCEATSLLIEGAGHYAETVATPERTLESLRSGKFDAVLLDLHLGSHDGLALLAEILAMRPTMPVVMLSADGSVKTAVQALHHGAMDFLEKPFTKEQFRLVLARISRFGEMGKKIERLEDEAKETRAQAPDVFVDFDTPALKALTDAMQSAAKSAAPVLLVGESGTGKTAAARWLHLHSELTEKPFVTVSCASRAPDALEMQLFGYVRGAVGGALKDDWGKVKAAEGGVLFLDEVGDLPPGTQLKLLRLIKEREYERIGETITRYANVRVVAAASCDLRKRVAEGGFNEDLFLRLAAITVELPPLRERPEEVLAQAAHYLQRCSARTGRAVTGFSPDYVQFLRSYSWPGNLRELHDTIERSVLGCHGAQLTMDDLPAEIKRTAEPQGDEASPVIGSMVSLALLEELHIRRLIARCANLSEAAHVLGIDPATLYRKRKKMGLRDDATTAGSAEFPRMPAAS